MTFPKDSVHPDDRRVVEHAETIREHLPPGMTLAQWLAEGDLSSCAGRRLDACATSSTGRDWFGLEVVAYAAGYLQASADNRRKTLLDDSIAPELLLLTREGEEAALEAGDLVWCVHPERGWTQAEVNEVLALPEGVTVRVIADGLGDWWVSEDLVERIEA